MFVFQYQFVTVLSVELHIATRADQLPDPEFDEVRAVFYAVYMDTPPRTTNLSGSVLPDCCPSKSIVSGVIVVIGQNQKDFLNKSGLCDSEANITYVETELQLLAELVSLVKR